MKQGILLLLASFAVAVIGVFVASVLSLITGDERASAYAVGSMIGVVMDRILFTSSNDTAMKDKTQETSDKPAPDTAKIDENTSDGYHTFKELYRYRMLYNAAFFNLLAQDVAIPVVKSRRHSDGEECFGGGWFIVVAELPTGQVSNHYEEKYWDLFRIPAVERAPKWDGHTPNDAADRLEAYCSSDQKTAAIEQRDNGDAQKTADVAQGSAAAIREALESVVKYLGDIVPTRREIELVKSARAALAAPARNCDVGTAEEQAERFEAECKRHDHCTPCPVHRVWGEFKEGKPKSCQMIWGQMPYEEKEKPNEQHR